MIVNILAWIGALTLAGLAAVWLWILACKRARRGGDQ